MPGEVKVEQRHKDEAVTLANRLNLTADQFTGGIADVFARSFALFEARLAHSASTREGEEDVVRAAEDALDRYVADGFRMSDDERIGFKAGYRIAASLSPRPLPTREEVAEALWNRVDDRGWKDPRIEMLTREEWLTLADAVVALLSREAQS